jgi:hypothetical protein
MKTFRSFHAEQVYNNELFELFYINKIMFQNYYEIGVGFTDQRYYLYAK